MAIGAAVYERFIYHADGSFLTSSFADYAAPTAGMVPELTVLHRETASPVTPLGGKGSGGREFDEHTRGHRQSGCRRARRRRSRTAADPTARAEARQSGGAAARRS